MTWREWAAAELDLIGAAGRMRAPRDLDAAGPAGTLAGAPVVSFASNDYLGLSQHPAVVAAAHAALDRWGAGAGAARLIVGSRPYHSAIEADLAEWKGADEAVLFPTGFAANLGVLTTFAAGRTVLSDELNHASIIDGCRLARARVEVYRHADVDHLSELLDACDEPPVVVTDTVFSMDGDEAPVGAIAQRCAAAGALLVVDEAHAVLAREPDFGGAEVVRVGTLSKTLGSLGGFAAASSPLARLLVNRARPYIFTTASTPADMAAARAALAVLRSTEGVELRRRLRANLDRVRPGHPSPVIPVVVGDEDAAVEASAALLDRGLLVPAIRPPTVAPGTSRLRVALSAIHTTEQIDALVDGLDTCLPGWRHA